MSDEVSQVLANSTSKSKVNKTLSGFTSPGSLYCDRKLLWIADSSFIRVLDTYTYKIVQNVSDSGPGSFGYSSSTKEMYVDNDNSSILVYNPVTYKLIVNLAGGPSAGQFAYNPINKEMYLTNYAGYPTASIYMISSEN